MNSGLPSIGLPAERSVRFHEVLMRGLPIPNYPSLRMGLPARRALIRLWSEQRPDAVHIATEGPLGLAARRYCLKQNIAFTSAFHTRFPEYAAVRTGISAERFWPIMRRFHQQSPRVRLRIVDEGAHAVLGHVAHLARGQPELDRQRQQQRGGKRQGEHGTLHGAQV